MDKHTQHGVAEMARKLDHLTMNAMWEENQRLKVVNADLLKALERIADLPNKSSLHTEDDLAVLIAKQAVAGIRHATG